MDWSEVHAEAEELEHAVSERLIERMDEMLGYPVGRPARRSDPDRGAGDAGRTSPTCRRSPPARSARAIAWRGSPTRRPSSCALVEKLGLRPGKKVRLVAIDAAADTIEVELDHSRRASLGLRRRRQDPRRAGLMAAPDAAATIHRRFGFHRRSSSRLRSSPVGWPIERSPVTARNGSSRDPRRSARSH